MKIRVTEAMSGRTNPLDGIDESLTQIDPGEYWVSTHHSGHYKLELPNNQHAFMAYDDFENGVKTGFIHINA